jgi:tetratricopeptide (TPR) repeat protein
MLKVLVLILSIFLMSNVSEGQNTQTTQDLLKSSIAHFRSGELDAALVDINKAIELDPKNVEAFYIRSAIRSKTGDTVGALADYNKIIDLAPMARGVEVIYTNRSMIRLQSGDIDGALVDLDKAISINPNVAEIHNGRAIARFQKGDLDGALADYEKAIELNPALPSALMGRGYFRMQKGDFDGALADFDKAIELKPNYADVYVDRGMVRGLQGNIDEAIRDMKKAASLNPRSISDMTRGNFTSPFTDLNTFIRSNRANARAYEIRGIFRLLQGKTTDAEEDFRKSLELDPKLKSEITRIAKEFKSPDKSQ